MSRFKIPNNWTYQECLDAITQLMGETTARLGKNQFDEAAKMLIMAARIMKEIPTRRRKEQQRDAANVKVKNNRDKQNKKFELPPEKPVDQGGVNNPFKSDGN